MESSSATGVIVESLTRAIVEHKLRPGTKLAEQKLADHFGVSRTLVRQASGIQIAGRTQSYAWVRALLREQPVWFASAGFAHADYEHYEYPGRYDEAALFSSRARLWQTFGAGDGGVDRKSVV